MAGVATSLKSIKHFTAAKLSGERVGFKLKRFDCLRCRGGLAGQRTADATWSRDFSLLVGTWPTSLGGLPSVSFLRIAASFAKNGSISMGSV